MERSDAFEQQVRGISLLEDPVRRALYGYVCAQEHEVGREEAANAVGVARALAAFHLDKLAQEGLLDTSYRRLSGRQGPGAGRPSKVYRRSRRELDVSIPRRRYELLARMFAMTLEPVGERSVAVPMDAARRLGAEIGSEARQGAGARADRADQLRVIELTLAENGFEPLREQRGAIRLRNCPFDALAREFTSLVCTANVAFLEGLVAGMGATGVEVSLEPEEGRCCAVIRETAPPPV